MGTRLAEPTGLTLSAPQSGTKTVPTRERGNEASRLSGLVLCQFEAVGPDIADRLDASEETVRNSGAYGSWRLHVVLVGTVRNSGPYGSRRLHVVLMGTVRNSGPYGSFRD